MHTWLLLGGHGMLGTDLQDVLRSAGRHVVTPRSSECDIREPDCLQDRLADVDVVVNLAAWTAVDDAETHEPDAFTLNAVGAHNVARACARANLPLVHLSTDYVFDGHATSPYPVDAPQAPRSAYGRTKAAGEWAVRAAHPGACIVRTAWLYGAHGSSFVSTMLRLATAHETLSVVDDQVGQPTWTRDVAESVLQLADGEAPGGYYHATSTGSVSWCEFTQEIFRLRGLDPSRVEPTTTAAFPRPAPRPAYSVLDHPGDGPQIRAWQDALAAALATWPS
ncbi:dTDP-4-dehydrorhamnose reductase [Leekyejoonella antrihumi]|uniref:dTDP-4-dehydrorhamnose reductase n=2 Tax=Leekyejoonella antrihumi TaxID=1660198 RepID=A0A563E5I7_9MICO|nr:dTDP-4-dehydrorhamnose reductase [Leekyejoonella antrihumi]